VGADGDRFSQRSLAGGVHAREPAAPSAALGLNLMLQLGHSSQSFINYPGS
jgi:hypothetical protein